MKINLCFKIKFILVFNANELAPFCHKMSLGWWNLHNIWIDTIPHNVTNEWSTQQMLKPASVLYEHISVWSLWVLVRELGTKLILTVELNNTCPPSLTHITVSTSRDPLRGWPLNLQPVNAQKLCHIKNTTLNCSSHAQTLYWSQDDDGEQVQQRKVQTCHVNQIYETVTHPATQYFPVNVLGLISEKNTRC